MQLHNSTSFHLHDSPASWLDTLENNDLDGESKLFSGFFYFGGSTRSGLVLKVNRCYIILICKSIFLIGILNMEGKKPMNKDDNGRIIYSTNKMQLTFDF